MATIVHGWHQGGLLRLHRSCVSGASYTTPWPSPGGEDEGCICIERRAFGTAACIVHRLWKGLELTVRKRTNRKRMGNPALSMGTTRTIRRIAVADSRCGCARLFMDLFLCYIFVVDASSIFVEASCIRHIRCKRFRGRSDSFSNLKNLAEEDS